MKKNEDLVVVFSLDTDLKKGFLYQGVIEKQVIKFLQPLKSIFNNVILLTPDDRNYSDKIGFPHYPCGTWSIFRIPYYILKTFLTLLKLRNRFRYIRVKSVTGTIPSIIFSYIYKKKVIVSYHADWPFYKKKKSYLLYIIASVIERIFIPRADIIAPVSPALRKKLIQIGCKKEKIIVHPNFVDFERFKKADYNSKKINQIIELSKKRKIFTFTGRLHPEKDIHHIIRAAKLIDQEKAFFVIAGTGELEDFLKREASTAKNIFFTGGLSYDEISALLKLSYCFLLVSGREGHPNSLIEAMAAGLPSIVSNVAGIIDIVKDKETALVFNHGDISELSKKIEYIISNPDEAKRIGENARKYCRKHYSYESWIKRELSLYK